jgi:hypothetical protein
MNGPDALTFKGYIYAGDAYAFVNNPGYGIKVFFFGQWSNGLTGYGTWAGDCCFTINHHYPSDFFVLDTHIAPEPSSLGLLVIGLGGAWRMKKSFFGQAAH